MQYDKSSDRFRVQEFYHDKHQDWRLGEFSLLDNRSTTSILDVIVKIPPWEYIFSLGSLSILFIVSTTY